MIGRQYYLALGLESESKSQSNQYKNQRNNDNPDKNVHCDLAKLVFVITKMVEQKDNADCTGMPKRV